MPSILVRLRQRAISQSTTGSHHSAGSSSHLDPSASSPELAAIQEQGRSPAASPISRRIVHDISGLLDSYSPETDSNPGLRPPRPRKRSTVESTQSDEEDKRTVQELEGGSKSKQDQDRSTRESGPSTSQAVPQDLLSRRPTKSRLARFTPQLPSGGWSTFGRNKDQDAHRAAQYSPPPSASQSRKGSADSSAPRRQTSTKIGRSKFGSISSFQRYANRSFASVNAPHSQSNAATISRGSSSKYSNEELDIANQPPSPPLTTSSRQNSTKKSSVTHSSHSQLPHVRHAIPPSSEAKGSGIDSPRTFGALTPPIQSASFGPIPPLPPFPPFISGLSSSSLSRSLTLTHAVPNFTSTPRRWNAAVHGKTYPPRRRRKVVAHPTQDENTVPFPSGDRAPTGRTLRGFSSLPRVREIFTQPSNSSDEARLRARTISSGGSSRRRSKTTSSRRSSAEWSAHQASAGVSSPAPGQFGWPAEVAREMFRMTFGGGPLVAADSLSRIGRAGDSGDAGPRGEHAMGAKKQGSALLAEAASFPSFDPCFDGSPAHQGPLQGPLQETHLSQQPPSSALQGSSMGSSTAAVQLSLMHELADSQNDPLTSSGQTGSHSRRGDSYLIGVGSVVEGDISEMLSSGSSVRTRSSAALRSSSPRRASTMPKSAHPHTPRRGILTSTTQPEAGPSTTLLQNHLLPSPSTTPMRSSSRPKRSSSEPGLSSVLESPVTPTGKGKRKAEEVVDITPPDQKAGQRATFLIPENSRRAHTQSDSSRAPSSYHRKRARISTSSPNPSPSRSLKGSITGTWSSRTSIPPLALDRVASRDASTRSTQQGLSTPPTALLNLRPQDSPRDRRKSVSELSIPISALIAPHAPSVSRSSTYHMRDPRRPPSVRPTSWVLHWRNDDEDGSVIQAWLFFVGFILFPLWWYASFAPIPKTRRVGGTDTEKGVVIDDPQVEHDARSWQFRCRIMSAVSFLTYIPFVILIAVFTTR